MAAQETAQSDRKVKRSQVLEPEPTEVAWARPPWEARSGPPVAGRSEEKMPPVALKRGLAKGWVAWARRPWQARPGPPVVAAVSPLPAGQRPEW